MATDKSRMWYLIKKHGSTEKAKAYFKKLYNRSPKNWKYKGRKY